MESGYEQFLIGEKKLPEFLGFLMKDARVIAPVEREGRAFFHELESPEAVLMLGVLPEYPPKKFLLPEEETLVAVERNGEFKIRGPGKYPEQVLFGLTPCDLAGIDRLDRFFEKEEADPYYLRRRQKTLLISTGCEPCKEGFCAAFGIDMPQGFDLHFSREGKKYRFFVGSERGAKLLEKSGMFEKAGESKEMERAKPPHSLNATHLLNATADKESYNSKIWEEIGKKCFGCTSCTMVCPTCTCFDFREDLDYGKKLWKRARVWDSCTEREFSRVADNHVFREPMANRQRQRMLCKLQYSNVRYSVPTCVGCGRCISHCTKSINIREAGKKLIEKWTCTNLGKES